MNNDKNYHEKSFFFKIVIIDQYEEKKSILQLKTGLYKPENYYSPAVK